MTAAPPRTTIRRKTLLAQARRAGIRIGYPCRGEGICGKCDVEILEGAEHLAAASVEEEDLLTREGCSPSSRMSCLAGVADGGPLVLRVGGGTYRLVLRS